MAALDEVIEWSRRQPRWIRHAVSVLIETEGVNREQLQAIIATCKADAGLGSTAEHGQLDASPAPRELPLSAASRESVVLVSLQNVSGVNALRENERVSFETRGLTIICGRNGSGKSGYARVLKNACRSIGTHAEILPNIYDGGSKVPSAVIEFQVGGSAHSWNWSPASEPPRELRRIGVFDSSAAGAYSAEDIAVAYVPQALAVLERLSRLCTRVRDDLNREREVARTGLATFSEFSPESTAGAFIARLGGESSFDELDRLSHWAPEDDAVLENLRADFAMQRTQSPEQRRTTLSGRRTRFADAEARLQVLDSVLGIAATDRLQQVLDDAVARHAAAEASRSAAAAASAFGAIGTEVWRALWDAARLYAEEHIHPFEEFPKVDGAAVCPLCEQALGPEAKHRFQTFGEFVNGQLERSANEAKKAAQDFLAKIRAVETELAPGTIEDFDSLSSTLGEAIRNELAWYAARKAAVCTAGSLRVLQATLPSLLKSAGAAPKSVQSSVALMVSEIAEQLDGVSRGTSAHVEQQQRQIRELEDRKALAARRADVRRAIQIHRDVAQYDRAIRQCDTTSISREVARLSKRLVSEAMIERFQEEAGRLGLSELPVQLLSAGTRQGQSRHRLALAGAVRPIRPDKVLSEGEQRAVALAGFLTELATTDDRSAIIFDDPVSSLDHVRREFVSQRLVDEAAERQVVIFTHDLVFLHVLMEQASDASVGCRTLSLDIVGSTSGLVRQGLPWDAKSAEAKVKSLNDAWQQLDKIYRTSARVDYDDAARRFYGELREAWEKAVEDALFCGAVVRFRRSIETKRLKDCIVDRSDYAVIEQGMARCSTFLRGHSQADALNHAPLPEPSVVKADIGTLAAWIAALKARRAGRTESATT
jgi:energy-coupling factor transporter ATP-binding protein EcfA2